MITFDQIAKAQLEFANRRQVIPTKIVMNPVGAEKLYQRLRDQLLQEIESPEVRAWILVDYPEDMPAPHSFRGLKVCYAYHYAEDYFEVTD